MKSFYRNPQDIYGIEVKTGQFRLTEDEKKLRELIIDCKVNYVPLLVERIGIAEEVDIE